MGNSVRSMPRKALSSKDSSLVSILLYDKKFPIMSIIGNRPERGKLLIFQDCRKVGRRAENGCLTPLQWISNFRGHPYSHSRNPLQWIAKNTTVTQEITYNESVISMNTIWIHHQQYSTIWPQQMPIQQLVIQHAPIRKSLSIHDISLNTACAYAITFHQKNKN